MSAVVVLASMVLLVHEVPPALQGIDSVPGPEVTAAIDVGELITVAIDPGARPLWRARAARLLGARDARNDAIDAALRATLLDEQAPGALRGQVTLALAERAARRGGFAAVAAIADAALADRDLAVARAGVLVWWLRGGDDAWRRLVAIAARPDAVGGEARGRLREFRTSGAWRRLGSDGVSGAVLDPTHGGPSPAQ